MSGSQQVVGLGPMAHLTRSYSWGGTQLGPIEAWSGLLLGSVNMMLSCRFPCVIFWGSEMVQFYNDDYLPLMTDKHPAALGQGARECWDEAWHIIGPQLEAALSKGVTTFQENVLVPVLREGRLQNIYWTYSYSPIFAADATIAGIIIVCQDKTGEVTAANERNALDRQLQSVLDVTSDSILMVDSAWHITYRNPSAKLAFSAEAHPGSTLWDQLPLLVYEGSPFVDHCRRAMDHGVPSDTEVYYPGPLNAWFNLSVRPAAMGIVLFFHDVTLRKHAEKDLLAERAWLAEIFYQAPAFMAVLGGPDHVYEMCNASYHKLIGDRTLIGKSVLEAMPEVAQQGYLELLNEVFRTGEPFRANDAVVALERTAGAALENRYVDFVYQPRRDRDGSVSGIIVLGIDVTDRKRAEETLMRSEKLAAMGRLASSIAHEINNPLEAVTNLFYLARGSDTLAEAQEFLQVAEGELHRVSVITNQTLRFYRQATEARAVSVDDLFESVLSIYQGHLLNSGIQVERRQRMVPSVLCFEGEIRQVLSNLIGNAIDSMLTLGGRLLLRSREVQDWTTGRRGLVLTIADTGQGINPVNLQKIFDAFFTTKGLDGNGLGLWVSKEIVERHEGVLRVRSSQLHGSTGTVFSLFLPFDAAIRRALPVVGSLAHA